ncbi:MAG TPA: hypothetical protein ENG63_10685 [Candidatus Desulfofervidus auxilii]|uniref:4Fe4S-binding SPASM domain-containing protein n=1 Tax=Desulfofervidus auxilii TaxID=1621989 RepID=A0A7C0U4P3_DESA2|nr:hypothetical protein [Candidatus Desulfofervidus auxilii]
MFLRGEVHYHKARNFISNLREYGFKFQINYVVHKYNFHEMNDFVKWAIEEGAAQVNFIKFIPKGYGCEIKNFEISESLYTQLITDLYTNGNDNIKQILTGSNPYIRQKEHGRIVRRCVAGYRGFIYITPDGSVYPCPATVFSETLVGNVYHDTLT